ncbi:MAG: zf-HC2 domain-containing protein [Gemmatimonadota bacterium]|nr:zf-HC2 domain-containing protein [Gemmatimonadota bacterium]
MTTTSHDHDDDRAYRYVAGVMSDDERDAFEEHLLTCAACRAVVRAGAVVRVALATDAPRQATASASGLASIARRPTRPAAFAALAAAVVVVAVLGREAARPSPLASIAAPHWEPGEARAEGAATRDVDRGMAAYAARDWIAAAHLLGDAARADRSPGVAFYHGAALLLAGNARAAAPELLRAQLPAGNPFSADASLLAAKALVALNLPDSALAVLARAPAAGSAALRAFADSIRAR